MKAENDSLVYQAQNGAIMLRQDAAADTIWATQAQMAQLFRVDIRTINEHIKNIFSSDELDDSVIRNFRITASDGKNYNTKHYNLDMVISVGYRVNSKTATEFRKWATKILKGYIAEGFVIDKKRVALHYDKFLDAVEKIKALSLGNESKISHDVTMDLVGQFAKTWVSLDSYDKSELPVMGINKSSIKVTADDLSSAIAKLKSDLIDKKQATEIFGSARDKNGLEAIMGNIFQSFSGEDLYKSVEEKAAHLLYFIVKNHIFYDGNKRSGAFSFIWFLDKCKILDEDTINPNVLTTLTLLIAESEPSKKDQCIGLVLLLLKG
jgi:death-on-curing family protein